MTAQLSLPDRQVWTIDDLLALPDEGHRYEVIDGSLLVSAAPTPWHQLVAAELVAALRQAAPVEFAVVETVDVDFGGSVLEPDVLVVRRSAFTHEALRLEPRDVVLAVEVESPSSRRMDRLAKPSILAAGGVPNYWRVELADMDTPAVSVHELVGGAYREVGTVRAGESALVDAPFAVEVRPAELVGPRRRD